MAEAFAQGAREAGHHVEILPLHIYQVNGCIGCNACRYGKPHVQKDNFSDIVPKLLEAGLLVFASPLYFWVISSRVKTVMERFYSLAQEAPRPPLGRYEAYLFRDCALIMTSADNFFCTFEQAVAYYRFALVRYIGFRDKGMLLAGGCGSTNGAPQIGKTDYLRRAFAFGKEIYQGE